MTVEREDYKLEIFKYTVNQSIDRLLPKSSEDALSVILHKSNEVVWSIATDIYSQSGHEIDFSFIRDILNLRIEPLRSKAAKERIKAELEAKRLAKVAERERIEREQKEKEQKKSQELEIFIKIKNIIIEQLEAKEEEVKLDTLFEYLVPESYNDYRNRMKRENTWCSSSWAISDKDADSIELIMAVEEEFDIEIDDQELDYTNLPSWNVGQLVNLVMQKI